MIRCQNEFSPSSVVMVDTLNRLITIFEAKMIHSAKTETKRSRQVLTVFSNWWHISWNYLLSSDLHSLKLNLKSEVRCCGVILCAVSVNNQSSPLYDYRKGGFYCLSIEIQQGSINRHKDSYCFFSVLKPFTLYQSALLHTSAQVLKLTLFLSECRNILFHCLELLFRKL